MLKWCGYNIQFVGGLFFIAGLIGLACGLWSNKWLPLLGHEYSPTVSGALVGVILLLGGVYIVLGSRVRAGNRKAAVTCVILAWPVWLIMLAHLLATWRGFYEFGLWSFVLVDAHAALRAVRKRIEGAGKEDLRGTIRAGG